MTHLRGAVRNYLKTSQKFCFHEQWLEDCIEWANESFSDQASSANGLQELVREQWLLGDLREISPGCLPAWLAQSQVGLLSGVFTLQVNHVVDVGASAYSQLEKLKGKEIIEEESKEKGGKKNWEEKPKASRLLMLELTDGIQTLRGMEHHPISCLHTGLPPGCKISVSGDIRIRQGALLLRNENLKFLGGQVVSLEGEREQKKLLSGILGVDANQPQQQPVNNALRQQGAATSTSSSRTSAAPASNASSASRPAAAVHSHGRVGHTDDIDDDDMEALEQQIAEELEQITASSADSAGRGSARSVGSAVASTTNPSAREHAHSAPGLSRLTSSHTTAARSVGQPSSSSGPLPLAERLRQPKAAAARHDSFSKQRPSSTDGDDEEAELALAMAAEADFAARHSRPPVAESRWGSGTPSAVSSSRQGAMKNSGKDKSRSSLDGAARLSPISSATGSRKTQTAARVAMKTEACSSAAASTTAAVASSNRQAQADAAAAASVASAGGSLRKRSLDPASVSSAPTAKRVRPSAVCDDHQPFIYLKTINDNLPTYANKSVWIKAFLGTLTSKLRNTDGWCVRAIVNDGSDTMEVEFGNDVLVPLIGFTTVEQKALYAQARLLGSPVVKARVLEGVQRCQKVLATLSCFLEIRISLDREFPLVVQMRSADNRDAEILLDNIRKRLPSMA